jgi:hypothetical protein
MSTNETNTDPDFYLLRLQITNDCTNAGQNLLDERHHLTNLHLHKMPPALECNFNERVASHVLDTVVRF